MAFAFSRSMLTRTCGSLAVKVVCMVENWPLVVAWATMVCATRSMSAKVLRPASCRMNWKPPTEPMPETAGGSKAAAMPPGTPKRRGAMSSTMAWAVNLSPILVRSPMGLRGAKMMPWFGDEPPEREKPMTEKVPKTPLFLPISAETRSANSEV